MPSDTTNADTAPPKITMVRIADVVAGKTPTTFDVGNPANLRERIRRHNRIHAADPSRRITTCWGLVCQEHLPRLFPAEYNGMPHNAAKNDEKP